MEEIIKNNLIQDYLKDNYEKQGRWYSKNKPLSAAQIPQWWIDWKDNNFVIYKFTGKFRKIKTAEFCKNVAGRNRRKCFAYKAEFVDADGNKFPFLGLYKHAVSKSYCECSFVMIRRDQKTQKAYCFECKKEVQE